MKMGNGREGVSSVTSVAMAHNSGGEEPKTASSRPELEVEELEDVVGRVVVGSPCAGAGFMAG
jgi:hypothetical protein